MDMVEKVVVPAGSAVLSPAMLEIWPHLDKRHRLVLPILLSHWPNMFPSHASIGSRVGRNRKAIVSILGELVGVGLLACSERSRDDGGQSSNLYTLAEIDDPSVRLGIISRLATRKNRTRVKRDTPRQNGTPPVPKRSRKSAENGTPRVPPAWDTSNIEENIEKNIEGNMEGGGPPAPSAHRPAGNGQDGAVPSSTPKTAKAKPENGATLARYVVDRVNGLRATLGYQALLGVDWGRLGARMKKKLEGGMHAAEIRALADGLVAHWPAVAAKCQWMGNGAGIVPHENFLDDQKIVEAVRACVSQPAPTQSSEGSYRVYKF